jgi:hypothetical protein
MSVAPLHDWSKKRGRMETGESDRVVSAMHEAEHVAESNLAEACASTAPTKADTGELIQMDELLDRASEAVKRAILLRRRKHAEDAALEAARAAMTDLEAEASADATHRIFRDVRGVRWDVFAVYPETRLAARWQLKAAYARGWLCFDSAGQKRRLGPVPADWSQLSNAQLEQLGDRAEVVPAGDAKARGPRGPDNRPSSE